MREITAGELCKILEDHKNWIRTRKKEGKRAYLGYANLRGANLRFAEPEWNQPE